MYRAFCEEINYLLMFEGFIWNLICCTYDVFTVWVNKWDIFQMLGGLNVIANPLLGVIH